MASALLRRSAATAVMAAVATIASPLAGIAFAADPAPTTPTFSPANSATVKANQPPISAAYATPLDTGASTLTVTDTSAGNAAVACPVSFTNNNETMACTPTSSLVDGHVYKVATHAVNGAGAHDDSATWTVDIPSVVAGSVKPTPGSTVGSGTTKVQATFDEAIDTNTANSFVVVTNVNGNRVPGSTTFTKSANPALPTSPTDTIVFSPAVPDGTYHVHIHVSANGNTAAFADVTFDYTVNGTPPPAPPTVTTAGFTQDGGSTHWANSNNAAKVPFAGMAPDGFSVGIVVYDNSVKLPPLCSIGSCQNDRSTTVAAVECGQDFCPWSGTIDLSGLPDKTTYQYWVFTTSAGGKLPAAANPSTDPVIGKDTVAPSQPSSFTADSPTGTDPNSTMHVTAQDLDNVFAYQVSATDAANKTDTSGFLAGGDSRHSGATDMPVGDLEDGAANSAAAPLTVDVFGVDLAGNASSDPGGFNAIGVDKETRTLTPDYADSFVTVDGQNIKFSDINGSSVHTPTSVTIRFNEILRATDADSNTTFFTSGMCFADNTHLCLGGSTAITPDLHGITFTLSDRSLVQDSGSPYSIEEVVAVAGSCPDSGTATCEHYRSADAGGFGSVASFTVDNGPPSVTIDTSKLPNPIDANSVKSLGLSGWTDPDTSRVSLLVQDSAGGNQVIPSSSITLSPPATDPTSSSCSGSPKPNACRSTWSVSNVDLSGLPDGTLTVIASAADAAGNQGPTDASSPNPDTTSRIATTVLQARPSAPQSLTQSAGNGRVNLAWLAPATNGGAAISGYTLTITDASVAGSAPQTVALPASPTTFSAGNLTNGHTYSLALTASNGTFNGPAATTSATPKGNTTLSSIASRGTMTFSQFLAIHGTLSYLGTPLANEPVTVTTIYFNRTHGATYHVSTDQNGNWIVAGLSPPKNVTYVASFAGDSTYNPSSGAAGVRVRALVRVLHAKAKSRSHLSRVTLSGRVRPSEAGRRIYIYELRAHGRLHRLGSVRLTRHSTWFFTRLFARGKHTVVARVFSHNGNLGNFSNRFHFRRT